MKRLMPWLFALFTLLQIVLLLAGPGCGKAGAGGTPTATHFFADDGARCYAVMNGNGDVVGGNCVAQ